MTQSERDYVVEALALLRLAQSLVCQAREMAGKRLSAPCRSGLHPAAEALYSMQRELQQCLLGDEEAEP